MFSFRCSVAAKLFCYCKLWRFLKRKRLTSLLSYVPNGVKLEGARPERDNAPSSDKRVH